METFMSQSSSLCNDAGFMETEAGAARAADPASSGWLSLSRPSEVCLMLCADVDAANAAFMAHSQVPWGVDALGGAVSKPAWKSKPSWYLVASQDKMIPPPAQ